MSEFVDRGKETKQPSEKRANEKGGDAVPDKKHNDAVPRDWAFLPGNFGMKNVG